ncbi:MAG: tRNA (N(6)-L-threonylcarbamoyladenosine(37)-C(2))-methylthiotransferase MtaB, partial [Aquamicrobium sp.]|nr:tRNA (N(6)-L-threonylcarbamoyladenosine(37)-C(2))-methylthiotransferase MtaB [Aquamicrobium sp.]
ERAYRRHLDGLVGTRQRVLVEQDGIGRTEGFVMASLGEGRPGEIVDVTASGHDGDRLIASDSAVRAA